MPDEPGQATIEAGNDRPDWLPDNFKEPAELAASYKELQAAYTRGQQEAAKTQETLDAVLESMQAAQTEPQQQQQFDQNDWQVAWDQNGPGVAALIADQRIEAKFAEYEKQQQERAKAAQDGQVQQFQFVAEQMVRGKVEEWDAYKERVGARVMENPDLIPQSAWTSPARLASALETAYKIERYEETLVNPEKTLAQQAEEQRLAKIQAQSMGGQGGRPEPAGETDADFAQALIEANKQGWAARRSGTW